MEIGYNMDKHLDEFEDFVRISKDARILDVAAGTGLSGQKVMCVCVCVCVCADLVWCQYFANSHSSSDYIVLIVCS